jgi:hypothetical protein
MQTSTTPLGAVLRGLVAGAVGTIAMDSLWYARYRRGGGESRFVDWEFSTGLDSWENAPAPAQVGKRLAEGFLQRELPAKRAALTSNIMHWGYGIAWGGLCGIVAGSMASTRRARGVLGLPFGAVVWTSSYITLPLAGLYKPMWKYDAKTLAKDLSAHLVYGVATSTSLAALSARDACRSSRHSATDGAAAVVEPGMRTAA